MEDLRALMERCAGVGIKGVNRLKLGGGSNSEKLVKPSVYVSKTGSVNCMLGVWSTERLQEKLMCSTLPYAAKSCAFVVRFADVSSIILKELGALKAFFHRVEEEYLPSAGGELCNLQLGSSTQADHIKPIAMFLLYKFAK